VKILKNKNVSVMATNFIIGSIHKGIAGKEGIGQSSYSVYV
jgi:hypothetical protein